MNVVVRQGLCRSGMVCLKEREYVDERELVKVGMVQDGLEDMVQSLVQSAYTLLYRRLSKTGFRHFCRHDPPDLRKPLPRNTISPGHRFRQTPLKRRQTLLTSGFACPPGLLV